MKTIKVPVKYNIGDKVEHALGGITYQVVGYLVLQGFIVRYVCMQPDKVTELLYLYEFEIIGKQKETTIGFKNVR